MSLMALPKLPTNKPTGRINRLRDDDEPNEQPTVPEVMPFIAADGKGDLITAKGDTMPKGQYDRSKSKPRGAAANDATEAATPRKPKGKAKAAKKIDAGRVAPPGKPRIVVERGAAGFTVTFEGMTQEQVATLIATL